LESGSQGWLPFFIGLNFYLANKNAPQSGAFHQLWL
jgi:hypothetical protein